jgi:plasmid stabilization system protein ParE
MRVRLTPETEADLEQAFAWYAKRSAELGADFFACFEAVVRQVEQFPESAPVVHGSFRRALLRSRFPYCVFYSIEGEEAVVVGCFHAHRDPEVWRLRAGV